MPTGYRIEIPPTTALHRKEIELRVEMLRDFVGKNERWFATPQEVIDYLNDVVGARTWRGQRFNLHHLRYAKKHYGLPYHHFGKRRDHFVSSNVLIMAWVWSMRVYLATRPHRPHTRDLNNATKHLF